MNISVHDKNIDKSKDKNRKRWLMVAENKHPRKAELKEDVTKIQLTPRLPDSQSRKGDTSKKFGPVAVITWF